MQKYYFLLFFLGYSLAVAAQDNSPKEDNSFKIVSIVFLVAALVLAIRKLKGTSRK
jgi:hypothetical protein